MCMTDGSTVLTSKREIERTGGIGSGHDSLLWQFICPVILPPIFLTFSLLKRGKRLERFGIGWEVWVQESLPSILGGQILIAMQCELIATKPNGDYGCHTAKSLVGDVNMSVLGWNQTNPELELFCRGGSSSSLELVFLVSGSRLGSGSGIDPNIFIYYFLK